MAVVTSARQARTRTGEEVGRTPGLPPAEITRSVTLPESVDIESPFRPPCATESSRRRGSSHGVSSVASAMRPKTVIRSSRPTNGSMTIRSHEVVTAGLDQPGLVRCHHDLGPVAQPKLGEDVGDV